MKCAIDRSKRSVDLIGIDVEDLARRPCHQCRIMGRMEPSHPAKHRVEPSAQETLTEPDGLAAFGNRLIEVHIWLREELTRLRDDADAYLDGHSERPRDLRAHCLMFCSALSRHHTGEDDGPFPVLAEQFPELRPALEELGRDHDMVAGMLRSLQDLFDDLGAAADGDPAEAQRLRAELNGLAAVLESHFVYEEKRLVSALNSLSAPNRDRSTSAFLLTTGTDAASDLDG
jgi:hemerythrin-like domain-containing protein